MEQNGKQYIYFPQPALKYQQGTLRKIAVVNGRSYAQRSGHAVEVYRVNGTWYWGMD